MIEAGQCGVCDLNRNHLVSWAAGLALLALGGCAKEDPVPEAFPQAAADTWLERYRANDAAGVAVLYSEDAQLLPPDAEVVAGRAAIQEFIGRTYQPGGEPLEIATVETLMFGDYAWRQGSYRLGGEDGGPPATGKFIELWKKVGGQWQLHREIWNADTPAPAMPGTDAATDEPA
jgi:ketosteroid isomerase-like protein